jgi:hypothetical protein
MRSRGPAGIFSPLSLIVRAPKNETQKEDRRADNLRVFGYSCVCDSGESSSQVAIRPFGGVAHPVEALIVFEFRFGLASIPNG